MTSIGLFGDNHLIFYFSAFSFAYLAFLASLSSLVSSVSSGSFGFSGSFGVSSGSAKIFLNNLNNPYPATTARPSPPVIPTDAITPVAPKDCRVANIDPAATFPIAAWVAAATEPAAIPAEVKPAAVNPPPATAAVPLTKAALLINFLSVQSIQIRDKFLLLIPINQSIHKLFSQSSLSFSISQTENAL